MYDKIGLDMEVEMIKKILIILLCLVCFNSCYSEHKNDSTMIDYVQAKEQIINNGAILVDVRTAEEYNKEHIDGAILLTLDTIDANSVQNIIPDMNQTIIVYCSSGNCSDQAVSKLNALGYHNVYDLGAMSNWKE